MKKIFGLWVLYLSTTLYAFSQVDTSYIYKTNMPYGTLDLRLAKSPTRYYYLQEGVTFSYRQNPDGSKTNTYTSMTTWNTSAYDQGNMREKNGTADNFVMNYRLLKPQNYDPGYSEGYPIIMMLHGGGEAANCWIDTRCYWATSSYHPVTNSPPAPTDQFHRLLNNDRNLLHGGAQHLTAVNLAGSRLPNDPNMPSRAFPGFVLFPQSLNGWGPAYTVEDAIRVLRLIIKKYNIDENRVYIHGLSNGGGGVYVALKRAPWLFAAALPMSAVYDGGIIAHGAADEVAKLPLWIFQGGQDIAPSPSQTYYYIRHFKNAGANVRYYLYPNLGHGTWNTAYAEPDFFSWILEKRKINPHVKFGNPIICNTTQTGVTLAFSKGFFGYQWERDGQVIAGATDAEYVANTPGTYRGRFSRKQNPSDSEWEPWSDPIVVSEMYPDKPSVDVLGTAHLRGPGLPSTDENNTVQLRSTDSAEFYLWYRNGTLLKFPGTDVEDTLRLATFTSGSTNINGPYTLVLKNNNCPSPPSNPVNLFFNNSSPQNISIAGDAIGFKGTVTASSIFLSWNDISAAETGYELWRRRGGTPDFKFVTKTGEDAVSYHDTGLDPGTTYEYKLRAVNNTGRSNYLPSDDLNVNYKFTTSGDYHFPPPPQGLKVVTNTLNTISLSWKPSADESSIKTYYVYFGDDSVSTESNTTTFTLTGLTQNTAYPVKVKALDFGNHLSQPSNQVIATTYLTGLIYRHSTGAWESLDDSAMVASFNSPEFTGSVTNFTLQPRTQDDYFNFQFTGYLNIETEGTYYFNITSSDGSRLILDGNMIIDNDGIHGTKTVASEAVYLTAGPHAIEVQYFDDVGGHTLNVRYRGPGIGDGVNFIAIPDSALRSGTYIPPAAPGSPTQLTATGAGMQRIDLAWQFEDNGQTDYEVYRATSSSGTYQIVTLAHGTSAIDSIGLVPGKQYYYKVKTVSNNGSSNFSNVASASTTADANAPSVPQNLILISKTLTNLAFSWNPSSDNVGVTLYEVFSGNVLVGTSTIHAFTAAGLSPNTQYSFTVKAVDASGNRSAASAPLVVLTTPSAMYYSLATGNLSDLSTWRKNADGTGDAPQNFSDNGQFFIVNNRTTTSLGGPWTVGGSSSRIIVPTGVTLTAEHPFEGNVELEGNATLNLDHATGPRLVKLSPESTVNFNAYPTIEANTYGNIILSGSVAKTFAEDTTTVLGTLTIGEGIALKGSPHNSSFIRIYGALTLNGTRPPTAADNGVGLSLVGPSPQTITTGSDLYLYRITLPANSTADIVNPSAQAITITLGSLGGGGLFLGNGSALNINNHNLILRDASVVNPAKQTGAIGMNGGDLQMTSTSGQSSYLYFNSTQHGINRFTIDLTGAGILAVRSPLDIANGIKIKNGTLSSEGNVTLLSTAERTAVIYEIENTGKINGEVTVQQHLPVRGNGYWHLSAPTNSVDVAEWQQSFPVTGSFSGASPGSTSPSLFYYRPANGWVAYPPSGGSNTAPIEKGAGYSALLTHTAPITLGAKGNPYQGNVSLSLSPGDAGLVTNGWNLVGNPYASPVIWSASEGAWTRAGVSNVIAIRKNTETAGQVRSQVTYYDVTLGGGVIPEGQAFWVRSVAATPQLIIHEKAKVNPDSLEKELPAVKHLIMSLRQGDLSDSAYILFTDEGTDGFDALLDGRKLPNYGMFNFSTLTADTVALAVNNLAGAFCTKSIALNVANVTPGSYAFSFSHLESLTDIGDIVLVDNFTGTSTTITGPDYAFTVTDDANSFGRSRFTLMFSKGDVDITGPQVTGGDVCAPGPGYVTIASSQPGVLYQVITPGGKVISDFVEGNGEAIEIEVSGDELVSGSNTVMVTAGFSGCDRKNFPTGIPLDYVTELTITTDGDVGMCEGDDVILEVSGAATGGYYEWYDANGTLIEGATGPTLEVMDVVAETVYFVAARHPNGCESGLAEIHIYTDSLEMPVLMVKGDTLYTEVVGYYQWKKDGEDIPGATLHYYVPLEDGKYSVVASNGGCYKESEAYQIGDPDDITGIENGNNGEFALSIFPVPSRGNSINIVLRTPKTDPVLIEIIDAMGRLHYSKVIEVQTLMQGADLVPSSPLHNGIYILRASQAEIKARKKIIIKN